VNCVGFWDELKAIGDVSYIFISLGSDELNAETAIKLRSSLSRTKQNPVIHAVVREPEKNKSLAALKTFEGESYEIDFIGDLDTVFSYETIFSSKLEDEAFKRHRQHNAKEREKKAAENIGGEGDEKAALAKQEAAFWAHEYNYKSSMASVIHREMRKHCGIPGAGKEPESRTIDERDACRRIEHRRWMAYMHTEGWDYGEKKDSIAKRHYRLVSCDELSEEDKAKDDV
jgi:hypothetical protein